MTYIYSAELLHEHDKESALSSTSVTTDQEELSNWVSALTLGIFDLEELVSVVHVACCLYFVPAEAAERLEGSVEFSFFHIPWEVVSINESRDFGRNAYQRGDSGQK